MASTLDRYCACAPSGTGARHAPLQPILAWLRLSPSTGVRKRTQLRAVSLVEPQPESPTARYTPSLYRTADVFKYPGDSP